MMRFLFAACNAVSDEPTITPVLIPTRTPISTKIATPAPYPLPPDAYAIEGNDDEFSLETGSPIPAVAGISQKPNAFECVYFRFGIRIKCRCDYINLRKLPRKTTPANYYISQCQSGLRRNHKVNSLKGRRSWLSGIYRDYG